MKHFHNLPIRQKMLVITMLICGAVLFVSITALFTFQVQNFRSSFKRDAATLAAVIANNSTAALAFEDERAGAEVVNSLKAKPTVLAATLVLPDATLFAHYGEMESEDSLAQFPPPGESHYQDGQLLCSQSVEEKGDVSGTLYLRLDYRQTFRELLGFYAWVILGAAAVSIGLAVFLSSRLGRAITDPVLRLSQTAHIVGEEKNYSLRAKVVSHGDEVGRLTESFNEMLARIQNQDAALSLSQQKMESLIHSIDGIVWERAADTFKFTFVSRQCEAILGYPPDALVEKGNFWAELLHPQDAAKAMETCFEIAARGEPYVYEYRMIAAEGRTVWIRESGTVLTEDGQPVALRGIFHDITQSKEDAEQLDKLNRQLMSTSRQAGMAEVATGVLHNVGNVLNSLGVSATFVGDRLQRSKVSKLRRATTMLNDQNGRLAEFLTTDPKGKLLPEYLHSVTDQIGTEQEELIGEMRSVGQHIEHIKEIVAMQQTYAKVSGAYENLAPVELVEDALRMNAAAFDRHHIDLVREYADELPQVCVDRHKVLQVLINLLRNAKYAMEGQDEDSKRLCIRLQTTSPDCVTIGVIDNGIGIAPENLTKIFNHGFTTKKDGHGFGLHSGANAAKEMGGCLTAHSDGLGAGACFTLELPVARGNRKAPAISTPVES